MGTSLFYWTFPLKKLQDLQLNPPNQTLTNHVRIKKAAYGNEKDKKLLRSITNDEQSLLGVKSWQTTAKQISC